MLKNTKFIFAIVMIALTFNFSCKKAADTTSSSAPTNSTPMVSGTPVVKSSSDGKVPSGTGVEKEKPAADKANVQGKALYNGQPAVGVEVKLCQKFNQYLNGCTEGTLTTKTDAAGEYLFKDVTPGVYEGLTVRVFNSNYFVFATSGIVSAAKYEFAPGVTFFAPDTNLFKNDLKTTAPKPGSIIAGEGIVLKWTAYPDAAYYKIGVFGSSSTGTETNYDYVNKRVDGVEFILDKPLAPGTYTFKVEAFNANDIKLSNTTSDLSFTVKGAAPAK